LLEEIRNVCYKEAPVWDTRKQKYVVTLHCGNCEHSVHGEDPHTADGSLKLATDKLDYHRKVDHA